MADIKTYQPSIDLPAANHNRAGSLTADISSAGIFAEVSNPEPSGSEIGVRGRNLRDLDARLKLGVSGAMIFTKYQGVVLTDGEETVNSG